CPPRVGPPPPRGSALRPREWGRRVYLERGYLTRENCGSNRQNAGQAHAKVVDGKPMSLRKGVDIRPAKGKLGILLPGMGAVATTFVAGVMNIRRGLAKPIGSLTQMGTIRLGKRTDNRSPKIKDFVPLADLNDLSFGGWDIFPDTAYEAAAKAGVLTREHLDAIRAELDGVAPFPAVFEQQWVKKLTGPHVKR